MPFRDVREKLIQSLRPRLCLSIETNRTPPPKKKRFAHTVSRKQQAKERIKVVCKGDVAEKNSPPSLLLPPSCKVSLELVLEVEHNVARMWRAYPSNVVRFVCMAFKYPFQIFPLHRCNLALDVMWRFVCIIPHHPNRHPRLNNAITHSVA